MSWKKNAMLFLTGQALSMFGSMVVQYAIMWHLTIKTQSGTMMTLFTVLGLFPMFLISPFGGVWADRFNRKFLINIADASIALASFVVGLLLGLGIEHYALLFGCALIRSLGQGVQMPAAGAFIPRIVPVEHLARVNGIQTSVQSLCMFGAPALSGVLMSFAPLSALFFLDVISAAIGIVILQFFVNLPEPQAKPVVLSGAESASPRKRGVDYFHDLKEGMRYIRKNRYIFRMALFSAFFCVFSVPAALLTPIQVTRDFGNQVWRLSAIEIAFSVGMMAGGILIGIWGGFKSKIHTMTLGCILFGFAAAGLGLAQSFWLYIVVMAAAGLSMPLFNTPAMVILQSTVDNAFMGRVLSVFSMIGSVMMPLGMLFFGPLADSVSIWVMLVITGIIITFMIIPLLASKSLREAAQSAGGNKIQDEIS